MILLADRIEGGKPDQETLGGVDMTVLRNAFGGRSTLSRPTSTSPTSGRSRVHAVFIRAPWSSRSARPSKVLARVPENPAHGPPQVGSSPFAGRTVGHLVPSGDDGERRVHELFVRMVRR